MCARHLPRVLQSGSRGVTWRQEQSALNRAHSRLACRPAGYKDIVLTSSEPSCVIGRSRNADYNVSHPQVSGLQCTLSLVRARDANPQPSALKSGVRPRRS